MSIKEKWQDPSFWRRFHLVMTIVWFMLVVPSLMFWAGSLTWVVFMSVYACTVGHFSSWQASRAEVLEQKNADKMDDT